MDPRFDAYGQAVCQFVSHATGKEKQAIQAELSAHMADHAQDLVDAGYAREDARTMAVDSMGDPEEVGKALNREYPLFWLLLSRLLLMVMALLVLRLGAYDDSDGHTLDGVIIRTADGGQYFWLWQEARTDVDWRGGEGYLTPNLPSFDRIAFLGADGFAVYSTEPPDIPLVMLT